MTTAPSPFRIEQAMATAQAFIQHIAQNDPELAADEAAMSALLAEETDVHELMRRLARFALEAEANAAVAKDRAANLKARADRYTRRKDHARGTLLGMMDALGLRGIKDPEFSVTLRVGTPGVVITDEAALPDAFVRVERTPDKAAIKAALSAGTDVPGAALANGMPSLTLRSN